MLFAPQSSWKHTPFMLDSCLVKLRVYRLQYWPKISPLLEAGRGAKKLGQTKLKSTYTIPISNWSKMFWSFVSSLSVKMETLHLLDNHVTSFIHDHISLIRPIWSLRTMETQIIAAVKLSVRGLKPWAFTILKHSQQQACEVSNWLSSFHYRSIFFPFHLETKAQSVFNSGRYCIKELTNKPIESVHVSSSSRACVSEPSKRKRSRSSGKK